jgi:hypothetical protein
MVIDTSALAAIILGEPPWITRQLASSVGFAPGCWYRPTSPQGRAIASILYKLVEELGCEIVPSMPPRRRQRSPHMDALGRTCVTS